MLWYQLTTEKHVLEGQEPKILSAAGVSHIALEVVLSSVRAAVIKAINHYGHPLTLDLVILVETKLLACSRVHHEVENIGWFPQPHLHPASTEQLSCCLSPLGSLFRKVEESGSETQAFSVVP